MRLRGELDRGAHDPVRTALLDTIEITSAGVMVDLSDATFIDAAVIGALAEGHTAAVNAGVLLRLVHAHGIVHRVLDIVGLDHDTAADADTPHDQPPSAA